MLLSRPAIFAVSAFVAASLCTASPVDVSLDPRGAGPTQGKCIAATAANLAEAKEVVYGAKIVPDVYDSFHPKTAVTLYYQGSYVPYGKVLTMLETALQPKVYFPKPQADDDATRYTLVMNDPDVPLGIAEPTFLHWIKRGLKPNCVSAASDSGTDVRFYLLPTPPPLLPPTEHRYTFSILREPKEGYSPNALKYLLQLTTFDLNQFEAETGAKLIGSTYFLGKAM